MAQAPLAREKRRNHLRADTLEAAAVLVGTIVTRRHTAYLRRTWLALAPQAQVVHGRLGTMLSLLDQAIRPPRALADGEVLELGGKSVRYIDTPHVPGLRLTTVKPRRRKAFAWELLN